MISWLDLPPSGGPKKSSGLTSAAAQLPDESDQLAKVMVSSTIVEPPSAGLASLPVTGTTDLIW